MKLIDAAYYSNKLVKVRIKPCEARESFCDSWWNDNGMYGTDYYRKQKVSLRDFGNKKVIENIDMIKNSFGTCKTTNLDELTLRFDFFRVLSVCGE